MVASAILRRSTRASRAWVVRCSSSVCRITSYNVCYTKLLRGGIAGNEAGKAIGTSKAFAYIVRFSSGESKEIIQGADVYIARNNFV